MPGHRDKVRLSRATTKMNEVLSLIGDVGFPIAIALIAGFFIFLTIKYILESVIGQVNGIHGIVQALDNRVKTMNHDIIRLDATMCRMLYMIHFIWNFITNNIKAKLAEANVTLIALIDRIRMLDNDIIRLQQKLDTAIEMREVSKNDTDANG
jgi:hypothetical protein